MKSIEILKNIKLGAFGAYLEIKNLKFYEDTKEAIKELEELNSCINCVHLERKEHNLKFECLIEVCRSCKRNNNDNFITK